MARAGRAWVHEGAERDGSWAFLEERTVVVRRVVVEVKASVAAGRRASAIENRAMINDGSCCCCCVLVTVGSLYDESFDCICELIAMLPIKLRVSCHQQKRRGNKNVTLVAKRFDVLQSRNAIPPTFHLPTLNW